MRKFTTSQISKSPGATGLGRVWVAVSALMITVFFVYAADAQPRWCRNVHYNSPATEKAICDNPGLWNLDSVLNTAYRRARADSSRRVSRQIRRSQRRWLRRRNNCRASVDCLYRVYNNRISYLEGYFHN